MTEPEIRRRRRPAVSCTLCRRRKIRCNREQPCSNCLRARRNVVCVYEEFPAGSAGSAGPAGPAGPASAPSVSTSAVSLDPEHGRRSSDAGTVRPQTTIHDSDPSRDTPAIAKDILFVIDNDATTPSSAFDSSTGMGVLARHGERDWDSSKDKDVQALQRQIQQLERQLEHEQRAKMQETLQETRPSHQLRSPPSRSPSPIVSPADFPAGTIRSNSNNRSPDAVPNRQSATPYTRHMHKTSRSVMHKTRLFGQSHWVNSIAGFRDIFEMIDPLVADSTPARTVFVDMQRLKHLGRVIKAQRIGAAPHRAAVHLHLHHTSPGVQPILRTPADLDLPPRALADALVACYMRSTESMYRILHVPMFWREYESLWQTLSSSSSSSSPSLGKHDAAFLAQLKLVLAIGASTHSDHVLLRTRAVRWFYAAQAWHAEPEYKAHLTMQTLQTHVLLLFAREAVGIGGALIWIAVGDLVRSAVYMGLHRDPSHLPKRMSLLAAEMRRRLWNTILELVVATSIDAGAPVMLSLSDFDAKPPANLRDEALEEASLVSVPPAAGPAEQCTAAQRQYGDKTAAAAAAKRTEAGVSGEMHGVPLFETISEEHDGHGSVDSFTQTSVAIALRRTWPLRLRICTFVNSMGPPASYADMLHLDRQFRAAYCGLSEVMQQLGGKTDETRDKMSPFLLASVDLLMRRYLLCLHVPFFGATMQDETAYAYSRRVVLETAMHVWHTCTPDANASVADAELVRQTMLGAGPLRRLSMQASLLVAAEIKLQLVEDEGVLGAPSMRTRMIRPDLLAILEAATAWCLRSIEAGETNFKGYLLWRLIAVQLDGMRRGMMGAATATAASRMVLAHELVQAAQDAENTCMPIMEGMVTRGYQEMGLLTSGRNAASPASAPAADSAVWTPLEVHAIARACHAEDCPCQAPYREQQRKALEEQQKQQQQQIQYEKMQTQAQTQVPMSTPFSAQTLDPMELSVDNWEFLMPSDPQSLVDSSEPLSWLFSGDTAQGIFW